MFFDVCLFIKGYSVEKSTRRRSQVKLPLENDIVREIINIRVT